MSNEADLRSRWDALYHDSAPYQAALRRDAVARTQRASQGRAALRAAMGQGNIAHATAIQQQMARDRTEPGDEVAGLDSYQSGRVSDYIAAATQRSRAAAAAAHSDPLATVANGPGYYASLENPDFATHFPYAEVRDRSQYGRRGGNTPVPALKGAPTPGGSLPQQDPYGFHRQREIDAYNNTLATTRKEAHLLSSLPKPLADAYRQKYQSQGGATPEERQDFLSKPPEYQWGRLRSATAATSPRTPGTGTDTFSSGPANYPGAGATKVIGSGGSIGMPTVQPLGSTRPTAALNRDVLDGAGSRDSTDTAAPDWTDL